ncbi:MAG: hypothetical protein IPM94_08140 [bacterium]|nr:hypothetical protein [bacterium]
MASLLKGAATKAKATAPKTTRAPKVQVGRKAKAAKAKPGQKPMVRVAKSKAAPKAPRQTVESVVISPAQGQQEAHGLYRDHGDDSEEEADQDEKR